MKNILFNVIIIDNDRIREINREYRNIDRETDVISFALEDDKTIIPPFSSIDGLGDVVAKNIEAEAKKNPFISIEDFQNRCKVSSTLIEKMKSMGIFVNMPETSQLTLF